MATVKSLEDMLSSEVDESAVTALVGSLESQLASTNTPVSSQGSSTTAVATNHVNNNSVVDNNLNRLPDAKNKVNIPSSQPITSVCVTKPSVASNLISDGTACTTPLSTSSDGSIATLPGALPASGYISQVTASSQPTFLTNLAATEAGSKSDAKSNTFSITTRSKAAALAAATHLPNGSTVKSDAMQLSSTIRESPIAPPQPVITTCVTIAPPATMINGKSIAPITVATTDPQMRPLATSVPPTAVVASKSTLESIPVVTNITQTPSIVQSTVVQATTAPLKVVCSSGQPISVVSQMVTNPSILSAPGVQILNVGPRLGVQVAGQKTLAPRVVLATNPVRIATSPQLIARAGVGGQLRNLAPRGPPLQSPRIVPMPPSKQGTITLAPGMVRGAVLLKTENGQLQVVNISGAGGGIPGATTYRLQSLPAGTAAVRALNPQQIVTVPVSASQLKTTQAGVNGSVTTPLTVQTTTVNTTSAPTQMSPNTAKKKCKNFLSTLIRLADEQPAAVAKSVRNLIQGIIDGTMQAEEFTAKLQKELNSAPQPYLVPFLKKNLPYLRHSLITKELTIEGVRPPPVGAVILPHPQSGGLQQIQIGSTRPLLKTGPQVGFTAPPTITPNYISQANQIINQRFPGLTNHAKSLLIGKTISTTPASVSSFQGKFVPKTTFITSKDPGKRTFSSLRDDDDINDVAAMGGVNLLEESQKILASNSEFVGTQIRSCKDVSFLYSTNLQRKIQMIAQKHGLEVHPDVANLVSHAAQCKLKTLIEKVSVLAEHRMENYKMDDQYEVTQDVRGQIKFLDELDRLEKRRHEEQEREILLRAAKSRSKAEDPEQLKLKQKAKEMQRAELEDLRQREANATALLAIGPRKRVKQENNPFPSQSSTSAPSGSNGNTSKVQARPRVKRITLRDVLHAMEQEKDTARSSLLYKSYLK